MFGSLRYNIGTARNSNGPVSFACIKRKQGNFKPELPFQNNTGLPWTASQKQTDLFRYVIRKRSSNCEVDLSQIDNSWPWCLTYVVPLQQLSLTTDTHLKWILVWAVCTWSINYLLSAKLSASKETTNVFGKHMLLIKLHTRHVIRCTIMHEYNLHLPIIGIHCNV